MFGINRKEEASLYYLYMMADGNVTEKEKKIFNSICKELDVDKDEKKEVIKKCKGLVNGSDKILSILVNEKLDEQVGHGIFGLQNASSLARIIWNLVNLGYADSFYSEEEKGIVNYLVDKWSVSLDVYQEFVDTADTILALTKQKEWLIVTFQKDQVRDKKERDINSKIKRLLEDVKLTIEEITM